MAFILPHMGERHKELIRGRKSVLDEAQLGESKPKGSGLQSKRQNRPLRKIIPFLAFAFIALMIARDKIPAVNDAWERAIAPDEWLAKQTCQNAALESVERREFARILKAGEVSNTRSGLYIDGLRIGEMGPSGNEVSVEYSCYLDNDGRLVRLNRIQ